MRTELFFFSRPSHAIVMVTTTVSREVTRLQPFQKAIRGNYVVVSKSEAESGLAGICEQEIEWSHGGEGSRDYSSFTTLQQTRLQKKFAPAKTLATE